MTQPFKPLEAKDIKISQVLRYFFSVVKKYKRRFFIGVILIVIEEIIGVFIPIYSSKIIDIIQIEGESVSVLADMLFKLLWIIGGLMISKTVVNKIGWIILTKIEVYGEKDISNECFDGLHRHSYRFFSNSFSGGLVRKVSKLSHSLSDVIDISVGDILSIMISLPLMIIIVTRENIIIGLLFVVFGILYTVMNIRFGKSNLKYEHLSNERDSKLTGELSDTVTNAFNVITFASREREGIRFGATLEERRKVTQKKWIRMMLFFLSSSLTFIIFRIIGFGLCFVLWEKGLIPASVIILVYLYSGNFAADLQQIERVFKSMNKILGESAEMLAILKTPHEIQDKTNKKLKIKEGEIKIQNINFGYIPDDVVIEDLSLNIHSGEKVAIVGESGSGKTTLVKLLFRFFDVRDGKILIDGQDISQVTQDSLRSQLSMVPQDALLFHRSIRDNIAYGKPNATEKEIIAAAKMARCHDFIMNLPEGYDSLVGERGIKLSGGERQRIAIARAILENCKILVLDEATSSLDSESEFLIQAAMDEVMKNKTAIVIAHRLSTIMKMDRIIVMDEGVIVEEGTHAELIKKKGGVYHKLWSIQSGGFINSDEGDKMNIQPKEEEEKDDL